MPLDEADDFARILGPGQRLMSCPAEDGRHVAGALRVRHRATVMVMMVMVRRRRRGRVLGRTVYCLRASRRAVVVVVIVATAVVMVAVAIVVVVVVRIR